ncbi:hypothetical protein METBIDRAFT_105450 [Metschnikowia bicuspidata var. bicuspidata NRRL YB-4993]|uniref:Uncharacterized protein n=1 Tax=Metschnikowia bicuspidata var. bicuspidata NRRL YB-4993 TaxID=869754 RepID=A0A1A0HHT1_9ASCO|nr:hypothetical protein METBIDRAFT_105450 [Metschnikowia bicuspidata var. bicuspidata NRRL YB-4993]OBA23437.1 hypothetical protein METBIDRAFT_105450 [Metschnikowia bicuspidata var. bicuspidata NRRL YB-4993]
MSHQVKNHTRQKPTHIYPKIIITFLLNIDLSVLGCSLRRCSPYRKELPYNLITNAASILASYTRNLILGCLTSRWVV